jgi:copper ion binding protein
MSSKKKTISIKGMTCKACVKLIESELSDLKGVKDVKVSLLDNKASVEFNPEEISLDDIETKISHLGYSTDNFDAVKSKKGGFLQGLFYGLLPHTGCIVFIIASIIGSTVAMGLFKPLLMNRYIFYFMILISFAFATVSSAIYLRKNGFLSFAGFKRKWKYLSVMYGSTVGINLLLFFLVFPLLANVGTSTTGLVAAVSDGALDSIQLEVDIPCPGHAPLISNELKTIDGVEGVQFSFPNTFDVFYDSSRTSKQEILSLDVFDTYAPSVLGESSNVPQQMAQESGSQEVAGGCGCGSTTCGGDAGSCCGGY